MKLNEITSQHADIEALLKQYGIKNYNIQSDGTVDVNGSVIFNNCTFTNLPIKFGKVTGFFTCSYCPNLTSLEGAPYSVVGNFICSNCASLTSLKGAPSSVDGDFSCYRCPKLASIMGAPSSITEDFNCQQCVNLISLEGAPESVAGDFFCAGCKKLTSLEGLSTFIGGDFFCTYSNIKSGGISLILTGCTNIGSGGAGPFKIIQKYIGRPDDIFECQAELIEAGYAEYAKL